MKLSLKWLGRYIEVGTYLKDPQRLAALLTNGGLEVEGIANQAKDFDFVVIGKILEKNKHPNADNLTLCLVDVGDGNPRKIVCGAKNHNQGDKVVVSLPGAILPGNFVIKLSKIRGEESQGMLCSRKELGLTGESDGILILPPDATVGISFAKYFKLDDVILDIKVTPNRSDCLSHFGFAREIAGLTGEKYDFPLSPFIEGRESTRKLVKLNVEDTELCPRYAGRVILNVRVGPSPEWLKSSLESIGLRSINNIVDITNFVMMEVGQPLHAFDISKIEGSQINVRKAKAGEKFKTLLDQELVLDGTELVIADQKKPVALAGVMGGKDSGVGEYTRDIFIESAFFLPSAVRRASRRHGIESDSSYRYSRGVDPDAVNLALNRACQLMAELSGGTICADSYDIYPRPVAKPRVELDLNFISARLGMNLESADVKRLLEKVGCDVAGSGSKLMVNPPPYRADLKIPEDLGEEILRLKGFSNIPETLPQTTAAPTRSALTFTLENRLCHTLRSFSMDQAINLSFLSGTYQTSFLGAVRGTAQEIGFDLTLPFVEIENPINLDLNVMRLSLIPSLCKNVAHNVSHGILNGRIFEMAPVFGVKETKDIRDETRPFQEELHLGIVQWGEPLENWGKYKNAPGFYRLKGTLEGFFRSWQYKSVKFETMESPLSFLHPGQTAKILVEGKPCGYLGVLHPSLIESLDIKQETVVCELSLKNLFASQPKTIRAKPLPKYPAIQRDVAFLVPLELHAGVIREGLLKAADKILVSCFAFDVFKDGKLPPDKKSIGFRLTYQDPEKTLSDEIVNAAHGKAIAEVSQKLHLSVR
jgi:phenylalanyl-tRNA synthetase beta chain